MNHQLKEILYTQLCAMKEHFIKCSPNTDLFADYIEKSQQYVSQISNIIGLTEEWSFAPMQSDCTDEIASLHFAKHILDQLVDMEKQSREFQDYIRSAFLTDHPDHQTCQEIYDYAESYADYASCLPRYTQYCPWPNNTEQLLLEKKHHNDSIILSREIRKRMMQIIFEIRKVDTQKEDIGNEKLIDLLHDQLCVLNRSLSSANNLLCDQNERFSCFLEQVEQQAFLISDTVGKVNENTKEESWLRDIIAEVRKFSSSKEVQDMMLPEKYVMADYNAAKKESFIEGEMQKAKETALRMSESGFCFEDIARLVGVSLDLVKDWINQR